MTNLLIDKTVIVAGASAGIGRAAATLFARHGANVVVGARRADLLDDLVAEICGMNGLGRAVAVAGDLADEDTSQRLVATALERYGRLDGALNNAATMGPGRPLTELEPAAWRAVLDLNLTGAFLAARHQIPAMVAGGGGSVVFTSTFVGHTVGLPGTGAYAASKTGLLGLTRTLAIEHATERVRVNALMPGGTDTAMAREFAGSDEGQAAVAALHALKRLARPEEIAASALYLLSDLSSFVTGETLYVDGGVSINRS